MDFVFARLARLARELSGIRDALERLADAYEYDMRHRLDYVRPARTPLTPAEREVTISYTDEEEDFVRELREHAGKAPPPEEET